MYEYVWAAVSEMLHYNIYTLLFSDSTTRWQPNGQQRQNKEMHLSAHVLTKVMNNMRP